MIDDVVRPAHIADVKMIIGRERARDDDIIKHAFSTMDAFQRHLMKQLGLPSDWYKPSTKQDKIAAQRLVQALQRVERLLNRADTRAVLMRAFRDDDIRSTIKDLRERAQAFAKWRLRSRARVEIFVGQQVQLPAIKPKPSSNKFHLQRKAVAVAAELLECHDLPLTTTRKTSAWCRIAAILYGDKRADLSHQCRAYLARTKARK